MRDLMVAIRSLRKSPVFAGVAVLSLAIAMGANSAIFSLVDAVLLRPLSGISEPSQLVSLYNVKVRDPKVFNTLSWPEFEYYQREARSFSGMLAYVRVRVKVRFGDQTRNLPAELVSDDYFRVLGIKPKLGRDFSRGEAEPVALISERLWRGRYAGDRRVVGSPIRMEQRNFTVIGVVPADYRGIVLDWGDRPEVWVPVKFYAEAAPGFGRLDLLHASGIRPFVVTGRLREGISAAQAASEVGTLLHVSDGEWVVKGVPLSEARFWPGARSRITQLLTVLLVVAPFILLTACANVAGLMLTRAAQQHRDTAVRFALGARARDVARQLLAEGAVISLAGTLGGLLMGNVLTRAAMLFPKLFSIPLALDLTLDWRVLAFTAAVGTVVSVVMGLVPLGQALRTDLIASLKVTAAGTGYQRRVWNPRTVLTGMQIALSLVLLVEAGLFLRTFRNAAESDPFLRQNSMTIYHIDVSSGDQKEREIARELPRRVRYIPGVSEAVLAGVLPMSGMRSGGNFTVLDSKAAAPVNLEINAVSPGFFDLVGTGQPLGRDFTTADVAGRPSVAIVNELMASKYWQGDAVGRRLRAGEDVVTVVGVVPNVSRRSYREDIQPAVYFPIAQRGAGDCFLVVRGHGDPARIRSALAGLDTTAQIDAPQTLTGYINVVLSQERLATWCLSALAGIALLLAVVGLYGIAAYSVSQRTVEVGIRMALGGTRGRVVSTVLKPAAMVSAWGLLAGSLLSVVTTRFSSSLFYGVGGSDPVTWTMAAAVLFSAVVLATAIPAWRVSRIEPGAALRGE